MRVEFGPPGHKGVTQIMGLGAAVAEAKEFVPSDKPGRMVAGLAVVTYVAGAALGSNMAKNMGIGGLAAILLAQALKSGAVQAPEVPKSVQGWG